MALGSARGCFVSQQEAIEFYFPTCARAEALLLLLLLSAAIGVSRRKREEGEVISSDVHNGRNALAAFLMGWLTPVDYANTLAPAETNFVL